MGFSSLGDCLVLILTLRKINYCILIPFLHRSTQCSAKTYLPSELTSGNGTKQDATIQQRMATKAMVSAVEISNCKYFFIINVLNWL